MPLAGTEREVLFVRRAGPIRVGLEALARQERRRHPGRRIVLADLAREILSRELRRRGLLPEDGLADR